MAQIVVVSGNPRPGSRTSTLAAAVATAIAERRDAATPVVIEVGELGTGLLVPGDPAVTAALAAVTAAEILVVATPTYKGSYTGVLKVLFDQLPARALSNTRAVPVVTAGTAAQAAAAEALLRQLLGELGAHVDPGLTVVESDLGESAAAADTYAAAHTW